MNSKLKGDLLLLLTAVIWGFAFVAQREGMNYIGPFTYNGIRFFLGATALLPLVLYSIKKDNKTKLQNTNTKTQINSNNQITQNPELRSQNPEPGTRNSEPGTRNSELGTRNSELGIRNLLGGLIAGVVLFLAASFQQVGIVYTTAGKAGFITGLYIVIVPFIGIFLKHKIKWNNWTGAFLATFGLYLLSGTGKLSFQNGDVLVAICAVFWAVHILIIGWLSPKMNPLVLSCMQFYVCAILCIIVGLLTEHTTLQNIMDAKIPILYGGFISIGIAYTLQVVAQKSRPPEDASIILSLEALFAAVGGWLILNEMMNLNAILGCVLMLAGIILSQISFKQ